MPCPLPIIVLPFRRSGYALPSLLYALPSPSNAPLFLRSSNQHSSIAILACPRLRSSNHCKSKPLPFSAPLCQSRAVLFRCIHFIPLRAVPFARPCISFAFLVTPKPQRFSSIPCQRHSCRSRTMPKQFLASPLHAVAVLILVLPTPFLTFHRFASPRHCFSLQSPCHAEHSLPLQFTAAPCPSITWLSLSLPSLMA